MVVCKCKKATKLYCFVHKVPVCGECICYPEHQICVVRTYSEWVIDGDYDWPPTCSVCKGILEDGATTTRLGCLHVMHTHCLVSHLQSFPPHTAPAGYVCPACSTSVWPPKNIKDSTSALHSKLKEVIAQSDLGKTLLANNLSHGKQVELGPTRHASINDSTSGAMHSHANLTNNMSSVISDTGNTLAARPIPAYDGSYVSATNPAASAIPKTDSTEREGSISIDLQSTVGHDSHFSKSPSAAGPGATTRKGSYRADKYNPDHFLHADHDDESKQKYTRRGGGFPRKLLRLLLPFWSPALPALPLTAPRKEDRDNGMTVDDEVHLRRRRSSIDPRKILLFIAIMSCMATMMLLYYRLSQSSTGDEITESEQQ
eukprot:TRINITY_DN4766_c0_g2_i1.p1 TRINITY_DN4766_c0_g2~~TRINITY_DN4766_c0_g2_i1.p1  ORF type:complete len:372 (-),score=70.77 TRINITY_DN4766_c0_g2_i1:371-1486(-)